MIKAPPLAAAAVVAAAVAAAAATDTALVSKEDKCREEIASLLLDVKQSISHGKKYEAPPRVDLPPMPMHQYEYEVST